jgi:hypothetical protein
MDFREREVQIEFFRKITSEGGALYMVCTDAAGEGLNMQFAWRLLNWDIPWNPARLEQRMGRIHRYKQMHDPVYIINLVAGKTREGRVMKTLLEKLERIRKELGSDKVFDVIGRLFEGVSIKEYMEKAIASEGDAEQACRALEGTLTKEQVEALEARERRLYGDGGDVKSALASERAKLDRETWRRLMPGYVRRFVEKSAPLLGLYVDGDLDQTFSLTPQKPGALDFLWNLLETYPPARRQQLTVQKPKDPDSVLFLHPGEPIFDRLRTHVCERFGDAAQRGGVFVDPLAESPYLFHLAAVSVSRKADPSHPSLARQEVLEHRLVGLRQHEDGTIECCSVEHLLLLKGGTGFSQAASLASKAGQLVASARSFAQEKVARPLAEERRCERLVSLPGRLEFVSRGYEYQDAELAQSRGKLREKAQAGDPKAKGELNRIKDRQKALAARRDDALTVLRREPELIEADAVQFLAHALVVPTDDPEDKRRFDAEVEAIAVKVAWAFEEAEGAVVKDVSKPGLARAAGLTDNPGFDLLSHRAIEGHRGIEVKGRAGIGDIELTENEWVKACNERQRYWLYVVFDCGTPHPRLLRVRDPFGKLVVKAKGSVMIDGAAIFESAEGD